MEGGRNLESHVWDALSVAEAWIWLVGEIGCSCALTVRVVRAFAEASNPSSVSAVESKC